jgi:hypothetical protein
LKRNGARTMKGGGAETSRRGGARKKRGSRKEAEPAQRHNREQSAVTEAGERSGATDEYRARKGSINRRKQSAAGGTMESQGRQGNIGGRNQERQARKGRERMRKKNEGEREGVATRAERQERESTTRTREQHESVCPCDWSQQSIADAAVRVVCLHACSNERTCKDSGRGGERKKATNRKTQRRCEWQ